MNIRKAVLAYIIRDDKILFIRKVDYTYWKPPSGGVEQGETCKEAFYREMNEELNLEKKDFEVLKKTSYTNSYDIPNKKDKMQVETALVAKLKQGVVPKPDGEEVGNYAWISMSKAKHKSPFRDVNNVTKKVVNEYKELLSLPN